ncbi:hypothetical protein LCGC14_0542320 [marine sediment metagenome]|uniref:Uncharacterized protein n=1 Tax=marine sediment metagenome TaxID=412755 RepID=A0A0F9SAW3_9ZZZZ
MQEHNELYRFFCVLVSFGWMIFVPLFWFLVLCGFAKIFEIAANTARTGKPIKISIDLNTDLADYDRLYELAQSGVMRNTSAYRV